MKRWRDGDSDGDRAIEGMATVSVVLGTLVDFGGDALQEFLIYFLYVCI